MDQKAHYPTQQSSFYYKTNSASDFTMPKSPTRASTLNLYASHSSDKIADCHFFTPMQTKSSSGLNVLDV
jgi:hypothetical protein